LMPVAIDWPQTGYPTVVERGLQMSPLLSANYLVALGDLEVHWGALNTDAHPLMSPAPRMVDRAVIGIGRQGTLLPNEAKDGRAPPEMLSTTALALFAYFGRHAVPTHVVRPESQAVPPQLIASVLTEAERLREENAEVMRQAKTIARASTVLGAIALLPIGVLAWLTWWLGESLGIPILALIALVTGAVGFGFLGMSVLLDRGNLGPPWLKRLAAFVDEGLPGIKRRWRERLPRRPT
jgi:hypothetical protein